MRKILEFERRARAQRTVPTVGTEDKNFTKAQKQGEILTVTLNLPQTISQSHLGFFLRGEKLEI